MTEEILLAQNGLAEWECHEADWYKHTPPAQSVLTVGGYDSAKHTDIRTEGHTQRKRLECKKMGTERMKKRS